MKIAVITPHQPGARSVFIERLKTYINRQTVKPDQWIVVDHNTGKDKDITDRLIAGLNECRDADLILIMEDDDWYAPNYIQRMRDEWIKAGKPNMIGVGQTHYCHIKSGGHVLLKHPKRASLMSSGINGLAVYNIQWPQEQVFIDLHLWTQLGGKTFIPNQPIAVGIKHGIGNTGGKGHNPKWPLYKKAPNMLASLIGSDAAFYYNMINPKPERSGLKIAIVTGVWQRPEIFELWANGVDYLIRNSPHEYAVIVAGSEGRKSEQMVRRRGYTYIEHPNQPLAAKMNATTLMAKQSGCDYVLCVGSDDVIHPTLMDQYTQRMNNGVDFIGVTDFYFYDIQTKRALYWRGYREQYRKGVTAGAGRLISARLMKAWNWQPWEVRHNHVLDNSMEEKLRSIPGFSIDTFSLESTGSYALDIKSATNMTPFKVWDNSIEINANNLIKQFDYVWNNTAV